jgi:hypothetical protein
MLTTDLKVMLWNVENLFLLSDQPLTDEHLKLDQVRWNKLSTSIYENKPLEKTKTIAKIILEENPDVLMLCEIGGLESLQNFNRLFLGDAYSAVLIEGNSDRNIDVGFLIKEGRPFYFDINSNKHRLINYLYPHERQSNETGYSKTGKVMTSHKFSRDAVELHFFLHDRSKPFLIMILTHLKSRLDPNGFDPNGFERRQAELKTLLEIYQELEKQFQGQVPIAVAGDMNGNASHIETDEEFKPIYLTSQLKDVCELAQLSAESSATFYQVGRSSKAEGRQIDYCFLSPLLATLLDPKSVRVYRFKGALGMPLDPPSTLDAKLLLPSDHYPLIFTLKDIPVR